MDCRGVSLACVGGVRRSVRVGARGSWVVERRGGAISSDEGVDRRDCKSGGGGDTESDISRLVLLVCGAVESFARATD